MPDKKISELIDGGAVQPTDLLVIARGADNKKVSIANLLSGVGGTTIYEEVSHAELLIKIDNNELIKGAFYCIMDYQCINFLTNDLDPALVNIGSPERLVVLAISSNTVSEFALSVDHPDDIITYDATKVEQINNLKANYFDGENDEIIKISVIDEQTFMLSKNPIDYQSGFYMSIQVGREGLPIYYEAIEFTHADFGTKFTVSGNQITIIEPIEAFLQTGQFVKISVEAKFLLLDNLKGIVKNRENSTNNVRLPYDFRSYKVRRYKFDLSSIGLGIDYYGWDKKITIGKDQATYIYSGGGELDLLTVNMEEFDIRNFHMENINCSPIYNNVFLTDINGLKISQNFLNNYLKHCENVVFGSNCQENIFSGKIENNIFGKEMRGNIIIQDYLNNEVNDFCWYNTFINVFQNNKVEKEFRNNKMSDNCFNNIFGYKVSNNIFTKIEGNHFHSYFHDNEVGDLKGNIFGKDCNNNIISGVFNENAVGNGFEGNLINCETFQGNKIGNGFKDNTIGYVSFENNVIDSYFYQNTINARFASSKVGSFFQNNKIHGDLKNNTFGNFCINNTFIVGAGGSENIISNSFIDNTINGAFSNNTIASDFRENQLDIFQQNYIKGGFINNEINAPFNNNEVGIGFSQNTINAVSYKNHFKESFSQNTVGTIGGDELQCAVFECEFRNITINSGPLFGLTYHTKHVERRETSGYTIWYFDNSNIMQVIGI
ncbi:MAG: hypothetical protein JXR58_13485 [Bacteroidales bacterium]|nr:hypothetical protein [Bacteroidales bacterium]